MEDNENNIETIDTVEQPYDPSLLDNIKRILDSQRQNGRPQTFEIEVDGLRIVQRTPVIEVFDSYKPFIHSATRKIIVTVYRGVRTPACTKHVFIKEKEQPKENLGMVQQQVPIQQPGYLNGAEVKQIVDDVLGKERMNNDIISLQKKRRFLRKKLKEAEEYIKRMQDGINLLQNEKQNKNSVLIEKLLDLAKNPPSWFQLMLVRGTKGEEKELSGTEKKEESENENESTISEKDKRHISVLRKMEQSLEENDLHALMIVSDKLIEEPKLIEDVAVYLKIELPKE